MGIIERKKKAGINENRCFKIKMAHNAFFLNWIGWK